jgi:hypothetical protein
MLVVMLRRLDCVPQEFLERRTAGVGVVGGTGPGQSGMQRAGQRQDAAPQLWLLNRRNACDRSIYSAIVFPEPPTSDGKSWNFGKPSFMGNTVSE